MRVGDVLVRGGDCTSIHERDTFVGTKGREMSLFAQRVRVVAPTPKVTGRADVIAGWVFAVGLVVVCVVYGWG